MAKILVIEDDRELAELVVDWLKAEGHLVEQTENGVDALERLQTFKFDIAVLDWELPGLSGVEICKRIRDSGRKLPILMLTGKKSISEKESGFGSGADDYLTKPFHFKELSLRIGALLRRPDNLLPAILRMGDLALEPATKKVTRSGTEISLLPREFALLEFLLRHPGQPFSADALLERVWASETEVSAETVRIHILRLRAKLDLPGTESIIKTIHRVGYKLDVPEAPG